MWGTCRQVEASADRRSKPRARGPWGPRAVLHAPTQCTTIGSPRAPSAILGVSKEERPLAGWVRDGMHSTIQIGAAFGHMLRQPIELFGVVVLRIRLQGISYRPVGCVTVGKRGFGTPQLQEYPRFV